MTIQLSNLENLAEHLSQIANEAKLRGDLNGIDVNDWRDIPTTVEELRRMTVGELDYWKTV